MAHVVKMPKMGEAMEEGQIVSWLVEEGGAVTKGEPLFELMTDKSTMEFPAPKKIMTAVPRFASLVKQAKISPV